MLTHHLTTEQILTLKQQNPQLFRQQKRYIRLIAIITAAIFLYYLFFFTVLVSLGKRLLMVVSNSVAIFYVCLSGMILLTGRLNIIWVRFSLPWQLYSLGH